MKKNGTNSVENTPKEIKTWFIQSFSNYAVSVITGHRIHMTSAVVLLTVTWE